MRIIAGSAKGIILKQPASVTRPTMDRVRAAVFSMLGERIPHARVLDLFAGTGAMGIEALSRGAASVLFVEQNSQCVEVIEGNLKVTRLHGKIVKRDVLTWLAHAPNETFDLVFADPPYPDREGNNLASSLLAAPHLVNTIASEGLLVLECKRNQELPEVFGLEVLIDRVYGVTRIVIFRLNR
ncbi:MAG: 16S rRNA (guanine(966)-N(2))-methyltransferase RsmD [Chthoniobacterales bacterium]|nr:16S rRNA (guanine(966)-N(2))-methyltransferase RsmD [Chthoniobacterales bacterium]